MAGPKRSRTAGRQTTLGSNVKHVIPAVLLTLLLAGRAWGQEVDTDPAPTTEFASAFANGERLFRSPELAALARAHADACEGDLASLPCHELGERWLFEARQMVVGARVEYERAVQAARSWSVYRRDLAAQLEGSERDLQDRLSWAAVASAVGGENNPLGATRRILEETRALRGAVQARPALDPARYERLAQARLALLGDMELLLQVTGTRNKFSAAGWYLEAIQGAEPPIPVATERSDLGAPPAEFRYR